MPQTVLVVDDEPQIVKVLRGYLEKAGFRVVSAQDGQQALAQHKREKPDLVLLDLNLPGPDGIEVARRLRTTANTPLIMVTARVEESDRLIGLEIGADDYVTKPFSPREVVARVRAVLRRARGGGTPAGLLRIGALVIDEAGHGVTADGQPVALTPTEFDLLVVLARNTGRTLSRNQLLELVYDVAYEGYDRAIDSHIKNLRRKLELDPSQPRYIHTVYGVGYKLADTEGAPDEH